MAYTDPSMTVPDTGFPIIMPKSGGLWISNPLVAGGGWYEVVFQNGDVAYYHADGTLWIDFPN